MAGNSDGEFVRRARACHRTNGLRRPNTARKFGIGHRLSGRHFQERLPYALLEDSAANIKGKFQANPRCLDEPDDLRDQGLVITVGTDEMRFWKTILKVAHE